MTTFDDDFIRFQGGPLDGAQAYCAKNGMEWPPPETLPANDGVVYRRESYSIITDEQREGMTHIMRGALYVPEETNA